MLLKIATVDLGLMKIIVTVLAVIHGVSSSVEQDEANCMPHHVHLSLAETLDRMVVMWATNGTCGTEVVYGTSPWALEERVTGESVTFAEHNLAGLHVLHRAVMTGLQSEKTYFYRPVSNNIGKGPFYFRSPACSHDCSPDIVVVSNVGSQSSLLSTLAKRALSGHYTALAHLGNLALDLRDDNGTVGDVFMSRLEQVAAYLPYMTVPGEREVEDGTFMHYRNRFSMPGLNWPIPLNELWYSFNIGFVHFIGYSTEVFFTQDQSNVKRQYDWLVQDLHLANQHRDSVPWVIAFGHRPMYCAASVDNDCGKNQSLVRAGLEDLFFYYGVDIVLQAHEGCYERMYPLMKGVLLSENYTNPQAPVQIVHGYVNVTSNNIDNTNNTNNNTTTLNSPAWSAFKIHNGTRPSIGRLHVVNATHALWEVWSQEDALVDNIWIIQENHGKFKLNTLPVDVEKQIENSQVATGSKPGVLNVADPEREKEELSFMDQNKRIIIGASFGGALVLFLVGVGVCKLSRRKPRTVRRWDAMDYKYGKTKLYAPTSDDYDKEEDNDFEVDVNDGTLLTTKLINGKS